MSVLVAACGGDAYLRRDLPARDGFATLLVDRGGRVDAHDLRQELDPSFAWHPDDDDDTLRFAMYRGTIEALELPVENGELTLAPAGVGIPTPAVAYVVDASGALLEDVAAGWADRVRVARRGCAPVNFSSIALPAPIVSAWVPALDGQSVIGVGSDGSGTKSAFVVEGGATRVLSTGVQSAFSGVGGAPWLLYPGRLARLDVTLTVVEEVTLPVLAVAAAESAVGPRFLLLNIDGTIQRWDGRGEAVDLGDPFAGQSTGGYAQVSAGPGGEPWANLEGRFAQYVGGRWDLSVLDPRTPARSVVGETANFGALMGLSVAVTDVTVEGQIFRRDAATWVPLVPPGHVSSFAFAEYRGTLHGANDDGIVEVHPGAGERATTSCLIQPYYPLPTTLLATGYGILAYARIPRGANVGWLTPR